MSTSNARWDAILKVFRDELGCGDMFEFVGKLAAAFPDITIEEVDLAFETIATMLAVIERERVATSRQAANDR